MIMNWELLYTKLITERSTSVGERHHIIPKSLGGDNSSSNLVTLSHRDHTLAHYIRYKWLGHYQDRVAYKMMSGQLNNPMLDKELRDSIVCTDKFRENSRKNALTYLKKYWSDSTNRKEQSIRRKKWISENNISGYELAKHLNTKEQIEKNKYNFIKWSELNPDARTAAIKKSHETVKENNKKRTPCELKTSYSRGSGTSNPNWGGYIIITNGKESMVYDDWSDAKKAPIGVRTLMKCDKDDIPIWFGKYKGYRVYRSKELI